MAVIAADSDGDLVFRRVTQDDITSNMHYFRRAEKQGQEQAVLKQCFGILPPC